MTFSAMTNRPRLFPSLLLMGAAFPAFSQGQGQAPSITKYTNISLGSIVPGASPGTAILNAPSGTRSSTGGTNLGPSLGTSLGTLTLSGKAGNGWAIVAGSGIPFNLNRAGGGTITVTTVVFEPSATNTGTFPASGTTGFYYLGVSASVGTSAVTPAGDYTGSITLRVNDTTNGRNGTTTFTVTAKVDPVITLAKLTDLRFGDIFTGPTAGTVTLSPAGARSATGGAGLGALSPVGAATFTVTGAPSATYAITLPASITLSAPGGTLTVSPLTSSPSLTGLLNASGTQSLAVGGTLAVAANQTDGNYTGTFNVTVAYN